MNLVYFKFLLSTTIKKRPVWITWLLYLFTATMFIIVLPVAARMSAYQVWANTTMTVCETFLGMAVALFTAVLAINIFKDSNEEGTELIIISKPISRPKIVFTKFVAFLIFCLMVNITAVALSCFTIFIPHTEVEFYWGLVISMFIGNLVSFGIFGSIAILLTVKFAKVGVIISNVVISLVFLIYQILTLFVFKTPLKAITDDNIAPISYVYADRNTEDGSYKETEFVDFTSTPDLEGKFAIQAHNWEDVVDYWEGKIKPQDPSEMLNVTDLASQVSLSYLSAGINKYSERQAQRLFGFSRFWDYKLTSPCSPELIDPQPHRTVKEFKQLPIVYAGEASWGSEYLGEYGIPFPDSYGFLGLRETKAAALQGSFGNKVPIGFFRKQELFTRQDVFFEKEDWNKYSQAFEAMYNNIFNTYLEKENGEYYYDVNSETDKFKMSSAWANSTRNLGKYYDLVWACLTGNESEVSVEPFVDIDFDIENAYDLNTRFLQFKYYCFYKALEEQQRMLNGGTLTDYEKERLNEILNSVYITIPYIGDLTLKDVFEDLNAEPMVNEDGSPTLWLEYTDTGEIGEWLPLLENGTKIPNIWLLVLEPTVWPETDVPSAITSALSIYRKTSAIFQKVVYPTEDYLYTNLDSPNRDATYTGETYSTANTWYPYLVLEVGGGLPYGLNRELFFYESKKTLDFWVYAVIWLVISSALFCIGVAVYNKYDVK